MADFVPRGIRARTTRGATAVVALALVVGAALLLAVLEGNLLSNLDSTIETQVADRVRLIEAGADPASLVSTRQDESVVWITDDTGMLLASGGAYSVSVVPTSLEPGPARTVMLVLEELATTTVTKSSKPRCV